jgi:hypothetical protein
MEDFFYLPWNELNLDLKTSWEILIHDQSELDPASWQLFGLNWLLYQYGTGTYLIKYRYSLVRRFVLSKKEVQA